MPLMTLSEYARHRGVKENTVRDAIDRGRIQRGQDGLIDSDQADKNWDANIDPRRSTRGKNRHTLARRPASVDIEAGRKRSQEYQDRARASMPADLMDGEPAAASANVSFTSARTAREIFAARLLKVELDQKMATLVDKRSVQLEAQNRGQVLRDALLNIPNRLAAQLAAEQAPAGVHEILESEIRMVLEEYSDGKLG